MVVHRGQVFIGEHQARSCATRATSANASRGVVGALCHDRGVAIVRYRYRAYPTARQEQVLARTFGCARVVFNDCLRVRQDAHAAGEKLSDTDVQRRVVTEAKRTAERGWLGEVASVALVQACQDARRAYRNWFDSMSGKRAGRRVGGHGSGRSGTTGSRCGSPATGSRCAATAGCMWRRVGDLRMEWSRPLPERAVVVHGDPRGGRPVLRVVRRRTRSRAAAAGRAGGRGRPRCGPARRHLRRGSHRQPPPPALRAAPPGAGAAGVGPQAARQREPPQGCPSGRRPAPQGAARPGSTPTTSWPSG